jgi:hypothetical protein
MFLGVSLIPEALVLCLVLLSGKVHCLRGHLAIFDLAAQGKFESLSCCKALLALDTANVDAHAAVFADPDIDLLEFHV